MEFTYGEQTFTIDNVFTGKRTITLCRANADGTLTVLGSKKLAVTSDIANGALGATYQGKAYDVAGDIYMSYIVIEHV